MKSTDQSNGVQKMVEIWCQLRNMVATYGDTLQTSLSLSVVLALVISFLAQSASSAVIYDRWTLLDIRQNVADFCTLPGILKDIVNLELSHNTGYEHQHRRKRGKHGRLLVRLRCHPTWPPIPSILLAIVQSSSRKRDELHCCISAQRDM